MRSAQACLYGLIRFQLRVKTGGREAAGLGPVYPDKQTDRWLA